MLKATHTQHAPWTLVDFNDQRRGRLTLIRHLLDRLPDTPLPEAQIDIADASGTKPLKETLSRAAEADQERVGRASAMQAAARSGSSFGLLAPASTSEVLQQQRVDGVDGLRSARPRSARRGTPRASSATMRLPLRRCGTWRVRPRSATISIACSASSR